MKIENGIYVSRPGFLPRTVEVVNFIEKTSRVSLFYHCDPKKKVVSYGLKKFERLFVKGN